MEIKINKDLTELLGETPMFRELEENERAEIAVRMELKQYDTGKELFCEGDPGGELLIIFKGSVEVQKLRSHGEGRIVIARFDRGGVLGEMSLIDGMPRSATVVAAKPTKVYILSQEGLDEIVENNPHLAVKFLKGLAALLSLRLRNTSGWFADVF